MKSFIVLIIMSPIWLPIFLIRFGWDIATGVQDYINGLIFGFESNEELLDEDKFQKESLQEPSSDEIIELEIVPEAFQWLKDGYPIVHAESGMDIAQTENKDDHSYYDKKENRLYLSPFIIKTIEKYKTFQFHRYHFKIIENPIVPVNEVARSMNDSQNLKDKNNG